MNKDKRPNEALRYHRLLRGWSQTKVADEIGAISEMVSRWERGQKKTSTFYQEKLCVLFGKNAEELGFLPLAISIEEPAQENSVDVLQLSQKQRPTEHVFRNQDNKLHPLSQPFSEEGTITIQALESDNEAVKRREATRSIGVFGLQLLGLPVWEQLSQALVASPSINKETLVHLEQLGDVCWRLANDSQGMMVTQILPTYLPKLTVLAGHPSPHHQKIASLVTRGYILAAEVEKKNIPAMQAYCEYAIIYSQMTNDDSIKADALRQKATIALIAKETLIAVTTYQQALLMVKNVSPLLRSRIYLGIASAYARSGQKQEALRSLGLAREDYPGSPEKDPAFLYLATSSDRAALHLYEALTYSDLQQPQDAWEALMHVDGMQPKLPVVESTRIEFLNLQAKTAALAGNMELSCEYLTASVKSAKNNGYAIWAEEAYDVYMTLCQVWPQEKQIKSLAMLFQQ